MGVDCSLIIRDKEISLDRWYVFSGWFASGKPVHYQAALDILKDAADKTDKDYHLFWIKTAVDAINKYQNGSIVFYHEQGLDQLISEGKISIK